MAKAKSQKYIPCTIMRLPDKDLERAAKHAIKVNPANAPPSGMLAKLGMTPDKFAIAVATNAYWGSAGVHASVGFMSRASSALQEKIVSYMNLWGEHCNVVFTITSGNVQNADCRISLGAGGNYSYLGSQNARIPRNQNTMNFQGFSLTTPDSEYMRVVPHEAGHYLGAVHEHLRRAMVARLDVAKTEAYFERTQGWTKEDVDAQVLTPVEDDSLFHTPSPEEDSCMCYGLPGSITKDGRPIPGGTHITDSDAAFMATLYPKVVKPPPPPPPPPTGTHAMVFVFTSPPEAGTYTATLQGDGPPPTP